MLAHPTNMWRIDTDLNAVRGHGTKMSHWNQSVVLIESQHNVVNPTNFGCALNDGVKHWLHVRGRPADDAEHLGGCRLMLPGLAYLRVALAEFLEQADVLDGDDGLIGESFKKSDLLVRERPDLQTSNKNHSDGNAFSEQGRGKDGSKAYQLLVRFGLRELGFQFCHNIMNMDCFPVEHRTATDCTSAQWQPTLETPRRCSI